MAHGEYDFTVRAYESDLQFYVTEYDAGWGWVLKTPSEINDTEEGGDFDTPCEAMQDAINYAAGEEERAEQREYDQEEAAYEEEHQEDLRRWYRSECC